MASGVVPKPEFYQAVKRIMERHWVTRVGYTMPNPDFYPSAWLWDSCFHIAIWLALGEVERAGLELKSVLGHQTASGFVPHVGARGATVGAAEWWPVGEPSTITQPPLYGYAVGALQRAGWVDDECLTRAVAGIRFLLRTRRRQECDGLLVIVHPSESGAGASVRFDRANAATPRGVGKPHDRLELARAVQPGLGGGGVHSDRFEVASVSFNALTAWSASELAATSGDSELGAAAGELSVALDRRWDDELVSWTDAAVVGQFTGRVRTLDALLPMLVIGNGAHLTAATETLQDESAFKGRYGLTGVHRLERAFESKGYWRGAAWPQLSYLFWLIAQTRGLMDLSSLITGTAACAAEASRFSEYFDAETGQGLGAKPQSWACLPVAMTA